MSKRNSVIEEFQETRDSDKQQFKLKENIDKDRDEVKKNKNYIIKEVSGSTKARKKGITIKERLKCL